MKSKWIWIELNWYIYIYIYFWAPENPWNNSCLLKKLYFPIIWDSQVLCFILIADPGSFAPYFPSTRRTALQPVQTGRNISSTDRRWWWSVSQSIPQSPQMNNIESEHMKQVVSEIIDIFSKVEGFYHPAISALIFGWVRTPSVEIYWEVSTKISARIGRSMPCLLCPDESQKDAVAKIFAWDSSQSLKTKCFL